MKYMMSMFGSAGGMGETQSTDWIREMIAFMIAIDGRLRESGEMVFNAGLADPDQGSVVRVDGGTPVVIPGSIAPAEHSLIGFWIVDVASEERAVELAGEIAVWSGAVELRPVPDGPPPEFV